ncbi:MAG: TonB family protein [Candidatus Zixiibacteriota bacterium]|nr:MAG: TonB family protein [candidate division Zixibacteria bacterium]
MKQDIVLSFLLHFLVIISLVIATPFKPHIRTDLSEVITVSLAAMPAQIQPQAPEPVAIPKAVVEDEPIAFVPEAKSVDKVKPVKKPKEKERKDDTYQPKAETGAETQPGLGEGLKDVSGNLGAGSKFGGAAIDNAAFDYPYWFVQAFSKIERNWSNPVFANSPLTCIIYFQVIRSGRVLKVEIEESSGIDAFDRACERAVKLSQPLPPLPNEFRDEIIGIHLEFPYVPQ